MRVSAKGQVTIPPRIRERFGFLPGTAIEFCVEDNAVRLVKVTAKHKTSRGQGVVSRLRGSANVKMTTDQILALMRKQPQASGRKCPM